MQTDGAKQAANDFSSRPGCTTTIIDASALLALLQDEPGSETTEGALADGAISAANFGEVFGKLIQVRVPEDEATSTLRSFDLDVIPVDQEIAFLAGSLIQLNHEYGLSLADRSCLATAISRNEPVVTADRVWANMKHKGIISTG